MKKYYLYLKESPLGLKYLGITTRNPYKYLGSGKRWLKHLKCHKLSSSDIKTEILFSSDIEENVNKIAIEYSERLNIVNSDKFANLMPESGIQCTLGRACSVETRSKISKSNTGRIVSRETIEKILKNRKSTKGYKHSDETRKKMSEIRTGKKLSTETIEKMRSKTKGRRLEANFKEVHQYDLYGNYIKSYSNIKDAVNEYKCDVYNAISGRNITSGGFQWRNIKYEKIESFNHEDHFINISKIVYQYNREGEFIKEWHGSKQPSVELNINKGAIRNCLSGIAKTAGGFIWRYKNEKL